MISTAEAIVKAVLSRRDHICKETMANSLEFVETIPDDYFTQTWKISGVSITIGIKKIK